MAPPIAPVLVGASMRAFCTFPASFGRRHIPAFLFRQPAPLLFRAMPTFFRCATFGKERHQEETARCSVRNTTRPTEDALARETSGGLSPSHHESAAPQFESGRSRRKKRWSKAEIQLLLETAELKKEQPEVITWEEFAKKIRRTRFSVERKICRQRGNARIWSPTELQALCYALEGCNVSGKVNWRAVADEVGRTIVSCALKASVLGLRQGSSWTKWTPAEDKCLLIAVDKMLRSNRLICWRDVSKRFPDRSESAVRQKLYRLDPTKRSWFCAKNSKDDYASTIELARNGAPLCAVAKGHQNAPICIGGSAQIMRIANRGHRNTYAEEFHVCHRARWTQQQVAQLIRLRTSNPYMHWCDIGIVLARTPIACQKKFWSVRRSEGCGPFNMKLACRPSFRNFAGRNWSPTEVKRLQDLAGNVVAPNWAEILEHFPGRTIRALTEKYKALGIKSNGEGNKPEVDAGDVS